jgi:hypothetical protein
VRGGLSYDGGLVAARCRERDFLDGDPRVHSDRRRAPGACRSR